MKNTDKPVLFLVGAGPGDPELITLKALHVLREAKVILYDALANQSLLQYASPGCITKFVGKRFGCHALSQQEINHQIVSLGLKYGNVVRLKGGDPFVFGRAHEEIDAARSAGMDVRVVPGISSALAVPASQLIPLTCRGLNESFWVTTGTTANGDISPDIRSAAATNATVIILMAMSRLEAIMDIFSAAGKADTPVAIIENGTTEKEKIVIGTVRDIAFRAAYESMQNPSIIIVGEVVRLRQTSNVKREWLSVNGE
jgi:uroporphyrin-III C-methyltransferase